MAGTYLRLKKPDMYPIRTYPFLGSDPLNNIANAFSRIEEDEGVVIQVMLRPLGDGWQEAGREEAQALAAGKKKGKTFLQKINPLLWIWGALKLVVSGGGEASSESAGRVTSVMDEQIKRMET